MDVKALFKMTYGIFVAGTEYYGKLSGCVINTAVQVTATPERVAVTMMKANYTTQQIKQKGSLAVSILQEDVPLSLIESFGMRSSRDCDKFDDHVFKTDSFGNPYLPDTAAYLSLEIEHMLDLGTHYMFICAVKEAEVLSDAAPLSYAGYRARKAGAKQIKEKQEEKPKVQYVCPICHYVYDGDIPFEELPDDYICPICSQPKSVFTAQTI